jgi:hypothetical protein
MRARAFECIDDNTTSLRATSPRGETLPAHYSSADTTTCTVLHTRIRSKLFTQIYCWTRIVVRVRTEIDNRTPFITFKRAFEYQLGRPLFGAVPSPFFITAWKRPCTFYFIRTYLCAFNLFHNAISCAHFPRTRIFTGGVFR